MSRAKPNVQSKAPAKKKTNEFDPEQYVRPNLPKEEVLEIKVYCTRLN